MLEPYRYARPTTVEEATALLLEEGAVALAGGTDLLVEMRSRSRRPALVVDLKRIESMRGINVGADRVRMGALVTVTDVLECQDLTTALPALGQAASVFGCHEIRHRATVGGNVANASPGAELTVPLVALDARVTTWGPAGARTLALASFLLGPGETALQRGELLTGVEVDLSPDTRCAYQRRARTRGMDLAAVSLAVVVRQASDPSQRRVCLSMGAVERVPPRPADAEALLSGVPLTPERIARAGRALVAPLHPRATSLRASPEYKLAVLPVMLRRILADLDLVEVP